MKVFREFKTMKIKIVKCPYPDAWYADNIGKVYDVKDIGGETGDCYGVMIDSLRKFWYVAMIDCEVLNE